MVIQDRRGRGVARFPAREVWSISELTAIAAALAVDAPGPERRAYAKLLAAIGVDVEDVRRALTVEIRRPELPLLEC